MALRSLKIAYVIDPLETLNFKKDTTLALIRESQKRGYQNYLITLADLFLENDTPLAFTEKVELEGLSNYRTGARELQSLNDFDVILMRKDPPVDVEYFMATYILDHVEARKTLVLNNPRSLRDSNEKVILSRFSEIAPPSLLTASTRRAMEFLSRHDKVVIKPTNKMGGQSVYVLEKGDPNVPVILEDMTLRNKRYVVLQKYIPAITEQGDQRILLINGKPIAYGIARMPMEGDHRGNLATGAKAVGFQLTDEHRRICDILGPYLLREGLFFVGIDVIGGLLTEVNITSPTGIVEMDALFGINVAQTFFDTLLATYFQ